jgi:hypothetical protein
MGLKYHHLDDPDVRTEMTARWEQERADLALEPDGRDCYGRRLTDAGWDHLGVVMPEALRERDDEWLCEEMSNPAFWRATETQWRRNGPVVVNYNKRSALHQLCLGEFNVAYIRGLSYVLLSRGETHAVVYRAGEALEPRGECTAWEGTQVRLLDVLDGHRARYWPLPGDRTAWSLPTGVGCHHSIHAVGAEAA